MFDQIAGDARFHFHGNVHVGNDVAVESIEAAHHAVVVCTGAEIPNRPDIPGAELPGVVDALALARWANGEPDTFDPGLLDHVSSVLIVGNGNVAIDSARLFARPSTDWVATDISPHAMEALMHHRAKRIVIAGRRGPSDASFTEAELTELVSLPDWDVESDAPLPFGLVSSKPASNRKIQFLFHANPIQVSGISSARGIRFKYADGYQKDVPAELVVFATGHRGEGFGDWPWDEKTGLINNEKGRVSANSGRYVCGWIKRGAKGLIGQNRKDAIETVACILEDHERLIAKAVDATALKVKLASLNKRVVSWSDWRTIDLVETQKGSAIGRPRITLSASEALALLDGVNASD